MVAESESEADLVETSHQGSGNDRKQSVSPLEAGVVWSPNYFMLNVRLTDSNVIQSISAS